MTLFPFSKKKFTYGVVYSPHHKTCTEMKADGMDRRESMGFCGSIAPREYLTFFLLIFTAKCKQIVG
jgi:hypothetical protein